MHQLQRTTDDKKTCKVAAEYRKVNEMIRAKKLLEQ